MSDQEARLVDCAHSARSVDSADLMYFVKSAVVSYAELCQCVQYSFRFEFDWFERPGPAYL